MTTTTAHTHPHANELTIGCPACIYRRQRAQENARWAEAPVRRVFWEFRAIGQWWQFSADQRVPAGADKLDVENHYDGFGVAEAMAVLAAAGFASDDWVAAIARTLGVNHIGPQVEDVQATPAPAIDVPLFEVPA